MKKIFFRMLPVVATGVVMTACNNAEEVKKQTEEQNTKIQSMVDAKLGDLQTQVDQECTALVDSLAQAKYDEWYAAEGKKKGVKPAPKPKPKAEEPKKETVGEGKTKMGGSEDPTKVGEGKPKMGGSEDPNKVGQGKPKMGSGNK